MRKIKNNNGAAMIAVLCIMAIFVTLCLSMLLTSSVLLEHAQGRLYKEQCKVSAVTMSKELEHDLCYEKESEIYKFVKENIKLDGVTSWPYLNTDELNHGEGNKNVYKNFKVSSTNGLETGEISAKMYWEWERGAIPSEVVLNIQITAQKNGQQHTIKSSYELTVDDNTNEWKWANP